MRPSTLPRNENILVLIQHLNEEIGIASLSRAKAWQLQNMLWGEAPCRASRAAPKAASPCLDTSTGTPSLLARISVHLLFFAPPPARIHLHATGVAENRGAAIKISRHTTRKVTRCARYVERYNISMCSPSPGAHRGF